MSNQVEPTRRRLIALARTERGSRTRNEVWAGIEGLAFNTYANFESGKSWPRSSSLRRIEEVLGWKTGAIDEALASDMEPALITVAHMRGSEPFVVSTSSIQGYSDSDLLHEMMRRAAARERYDLAASDELGGISKGDVGEGS
ncbi:hypothetical protein [Arthrobacter roseus]|uniref:hypothetical protein n=1 Tax=Arthrobacter roseus TaxID=136274 RepID=UPI0019624E74|nr:hypothetical protein [Arthrobacter roseus]MBM7847512.1 transcriptional regulator with XRE-family HTH domain [Arthrobacter roseus]